MPGRLFYFTGRFAAHHQTGNHADIHSFRPLNIKHPDNAIAQIDDGFSVGLQGFLVTDEKPRAPGKRAPAEEGKKMQGSAKDQQWASGLRELYDSVVDEPLPDSFKDLISKLDGDTK